MGDLNSSCEIETYKIPFGSCQTWARITRPVVVDDRKSPVVILHGGPGLAHDYCLPMAMLARDGRPVLHYDQVGCGLSTHLPDAPEDFWSVRLFVDELKNLVDYYGFGETGFHLVGQSWGGMLAPEYVLQHPEGVASMTLANAPASMELWVQGTRELLRRLPEDVQATVREHELAGTTDSRAYAEAVDVFYHHFLCRVDPFPKDLQASFAATEADPTVYQTMIGPSEFSVTGTLRDWSVVDRLDRITLPALVIAGEFDEARPEAWQPFVDRLSDVEHHVFPGASHTPHLEYPEQFTDRVGRFLRQHDGNRK